jgi:hypothetical protein
MEDLNGRMKDMDAAFESLKAALLSTTRIVVDNFSKVSGGLDPDVIQAFKDLGENIGEAPPIQKSSRTNQRGWRDT